jgi:hypothetical protein
VKKSGIELLIERLRKQQELFERHTNPLPASLQNVINLSNQLKNPQFESVRNISNLAGTRALAEKLANNIPPSVLNSIYTSPTTIQITPELHHNFNRIRNLIDTLDGFKNVNLNSVSLTPSENIEHCSLEERTEVNTQSLASAEEEIKNQKELNADFGKLKPETQKFIRDQALNFLWVLFSIYLSRELAKHDDNISISESPPSVTQPALTSQPFDITEVMEFYSLLFSEMGTVKAKKGLNLREGPGINYKTLTTLPNGTSLEILDKTNDGWLQVSSVNQSDNTLGWVSESFVQYE